MSETVPAAGSKIIYRIAKADDYNELYVFLNRTFYKDEPINAGFVLEGPVPEDTVYTLSTLGLETSVVAIDKTDNKIIGVCMTGPGLPSDIEDMRKEIGKTANRKFQQYLRLYIHIDTESSIHVRHNIERTLHVHGVAVDPRYRGQGIGCALVRRAYEIGKNLSYPVGSINCSSVYTIRIAEKLNMRMVSSIAYEDIRDENGERLIYPPAPHTHIQTFIVDL